MTCHHCAQAHDPADGRCVELLAARLRSRDESLEQSWLLLRALETVLRFSTCPAGQLARDLLRAEP